MEEKLLNALKWDYNEEQQELAMRALEGINSSDLKLLICPINKDYWENAAIVLERIGYPRIKTILYDLFTWIKDMNWPGAMRICNLLKTVPKSDLIPALESAIYKAASDLDAMWLYWLNDFVEYAKINKNDFTHMEYYYILKKEKKYIEMEEQIEEDLVFIQSRIKNDTKAQYLTDKRLKLIKKQKYLCNKHQKEIKSLLQSITGII